MDLAHSYYTYVAVRISVSANGSHPKVDCQMRARSFSFGFSATMESLSLSELKTKCRQLGLSQNGRKAHLITRIKKYRAAKIDGAVAQKELSEAIIATKIRNPRPASRQGVLLKARDTIMNISITHNAPLVIDVVQGSPVVGNQDGVNYAVERSDLAEQVNTLQAQMMDLTEQFGQMQSVIAVLKEDSNKFHSVRQRFLSVDKHRQYHCS